MVAAAGDSRVQLLVRQLNASLGLSHAMAEVAAGVWLGLPEKAIASWLAKPQATVHEHLRRIYRDPRWPGLRCRVTLAVAVERVRAENREHGRSGVPHPVDTCLGDET